MKENLLIIGISGVTNGGKTTLAQKLKNALPNCRVIQQDDYFLPPNDPQHTHIPELNHINWDILTSLDMQKMMQEVNSCVLTLSKEVERCKTEAQATDGKQILIIEGFCLFAFKPIEKICNLKYFLTLNKEECSKRRSSRVYEPPDCPGYFLQCAWPEYLKQMDYVKNNVQNVCFLDENTDSFSYVLKDLDCYLKS